MSKRIKLDLDRASQVMNTFAQQGWQKLAAQLKKWQSARAYIPAKYFTMLEADEFNKDYRPTGNARIKLVITKPLVIDKDGVRGVFSVLPEDLPRVQSRKLDDSPNFQGAKLRIVLIVAEKGEQGFTFRPHEFLFNEESGEAVVKIGLKELNMAPPSRRLNLRGGKLWPVGAYSVQVVAYDFTPVRIPIIPRIKN